MQHFPSLLSSSQVSRKHRVAPTWTERRGDVKLSSVETQGRGNFLAGGQQWVCGSVTEEPVQQQMNGVLGTPLIGGKINMKKCDSMSVKNEQKSLLNHVFSYSLKLLKTLKNWTTCSYLMTCSLSI